MHHPLGCSGLKHPPVLQLDLCEDGKARCTEQERKSGMSQLGRLAKREDLGFSLFFRVICSSHIKQTLNKRQIQKWTWLHCGLNALTTVGYQAEEEIITNSSFSWGVPFLSSLLLLLNSAVLLKINCAVTSSRDDRMLLMEHQDWYTCYSPVSEVQTYFSPWCLFTFGQRLLARAESFAHLNFLIQFK